MIHQPYRGTIRDAAGVIYEVAWAECKPTAKVFTGETIFRSNRYYPEIPWADDIYGALPTERLEWSPYARTGVPDRVCGDCYIGDAEWFASGDFPDDAPPVELGPDGFGLNCNGDAMAVTSVGLAAAVPFRVSNTPITSRGVISLDWGPRNVGDTLVVQPDGTVNFQAATGGGGELVTPGEWLFGTTQTLQITWLSGDVVCSIEYAVANLDGSNPVLSRSFIHLTTSPQTILTGINGKLVALVHASLVNQDAGSVTDYQLQLKDGSNVRTILDWVMQRSAIPTVPGAATTFDPIVSDWRYADAYLSIGADSLYNFPAPVVIPTAQFFPPAIVPSEPGSLYVDPITGALTFVNPDLSLTVIAGPGGCCDYIEFDVFASDIRTSPTVIYEFVDGQTLESIQEAFIASFSDLGTIATLSFNWENDNGGTGSLGAFKNINPSIPPSDQLSILFGPATFNRGAFGNKWRLTMVANVNDSGTHGHWKMWLKITTPPDAS